MSNVILGKNLNIYYTLNGNNYPLAHATDCIIELTSETQETTTQSSGKGKTFDYKGKYSYTLSADGITNLVDIANFSVFQQAIIQSTKLIFLFTDLSQVQYSGIVLITKNSLKSPFDAASTFSNAMLGDGELTIVVTSVPVPPVGINVSIIDQFGNVLAVVPAPGTYSVLRFDTIDCGAAIQLNPLIIMQAS